MRSTIDPWLEEETVSAEQHMHHQMAGRIILDFAKRGNDLCQVFEQEALMDHLAFSVNQPLRTFGSHLSGLAGRDIDHDLTEPTQTAL